VIPAPVLRANDLALWTGMAVYETLRSYDQRPFRLDAHLDRLGRSAAWMGYAWDRADIARRLTELCGAAAAQKLNVLVTGEQSVVVAAPLDLARVGAPVRCATTPLLANPGLPAFIKHTSRAPGELAARDASQRLGEPIDEVIWQDDRGCWTEANRSNLIAIRDGAIWTPPSDGRILEGVTRAWILEAARAFGMATHEADVGADQVWDELYLCSTLKELAPVVRLDGRAAPGAGPIGQRVAEAMTALRRGEASCS
jgi:branched-subunit amino acid aminotransferase/4-amino-4-deoxychorismate lyase